MMIVALTAQGASFFPRQSSLPALGGESQIFEVQPLTERCRPPLAIAAAVPPERAAEICRQKVFLRAAGSQLFFFSIPMRVDRGIDREETAVAAVSERYRGDNVFRVKPSRQLVAPRRLLPRIRGRFPSMKAPVTPACLNKNKSRIRYL
jgi:hypothetical protein